ncbi:MAG: carboxypeptidase regulatory-like domain-containing protein [Anaerolineae bacterium]|nr:carboxypeptidase regulatory-like domain-containing protein [Anaerolineae bacterium]
MKSRRTFHIVVLLAMLFSLAAAAVQAAPAQPQPENPTSAILGPFTSDPVYPTVWNGDLRDLPQANEADGQTGDAPEIAPARLTPVEMAAINAKAAQRVGTVQSQWAGEDPAPPPIENFAGMQFSANGAGWPPDTNGDVGPNHYIQTVNTSVGIYSKTGTPLSVVTFNTFFQGPSGTPCDTSNDGDPVVLYDAAVDRWIVTDFAWFNFNTGPYYQCIAVSQTGDPVAGGWYFYAMQANTGVFAGDNFNDYPKLGVWPDGYYMSANMFEAVGDGFGVRLWGINKIPLLSGGPLEEVHFDLCLDGSCGSFLPSNLRGPAPPAGAPNYFGTISAPDGFDIYEFHADFATPANSTLTGPVTVPIAPFVGYNDEIPQPGVGTGLDSLSFRPMMQLQYRNMGSYESLWATHTVDEEGLAVARWYEMRDPGGSPTLFQQGSLNPGDGVNRWMASIAADQDGNAAIGYSVANSTVYPGIRYQGRLNGEAPGQMPQTEQVLVNGTGSQNGISRWGDYSAMSVDPTDDCTFWYTQEYYTTTGSNWQTRIGSFKFPSCGETKGTITGRVVNAVTNDGVADAPVTIASVVESSVTVMTDANGYYSIDVLPDTYNVTAGPLLPGYPTPNGANGQVVAASSTTTVPDIPLSPVPNLVYDANTVDDNGPGGNGNGYPEPGESGVQVFVNLLNNGADTSTGVSAVLSSPTSGVSVTQDTSTYPDIPAGAVRDNNTPYVISLDPLMPCGTILDFQLDVTTNEGNYTMYFSIQASIPQAPQSVFFDDFENGVNGWTTGGTNNLWAQTTEEAYSPTHSWTDSPGGNYPNNMNSWLQSPVIDLSGKSGVTVSAYWLYALEPGFDYAYLEYSTDGGSTYNPTALATFNGVQSDWAQSVEDASVLNDQANARLRIRAYSDGGVVFDGVYVDNFDVSYVPIVCEPPPTAVELADFGADSTPVNGSALLVILAAGLAIAAVVMLQRRSAVEQ